MASRKDFTESWLSEMPQGLGNFELYDMIAYNINNQKKNGASVQALPNGLFKIQKLHTAYYWYERDNQIVLAAEFLVRPQSLTVHAVGKSPRHRNRAPYATDLYQAVLADSDKSIRLFSDSQLSDQGYLVWKKLLDSGCKISVYDRENPGQSFVTVANATELAKYFQNDNTDYQRFQYVLSEAAQYPDTLSYFNTRRMRELSGQSLNDSPTNKY
jgi:hypothetical protein